MGDETWNSIYKRKKKREEKIPEKNPFDVWKREYNPLAGNKNDDGEDLHERVRKNWESRTLPETVNSGSLREPGNAFSQAPPRLPERHISKVEFPQKAELSENDFAMEYPAFAENSLTDYELMSNPTGEETEQTESKDAGKETDWLGYFISESFRIAEEEERAKQETFNKIQKEAQREFWREGGKIVLKDYPVSRFMLEHSLQDNPTAMIRGNESDIADLIKKDPVYLNALDKAIANSDGKTIDTDLEGIAFKTPDLYYSIHKATIHVKGYKNKEGKWIITAMLEDTYDFTEWMTLSKNENEEWTINISKGTVANDVAKISQFLGAINPYKIRVYFNTVR